jgi:hypothetical protein
MSDRCKEQPDRFLIEHATSAALPAPHGPKFRAWVGNARNLQVIDVGNVYELGNSGDQEQTTRMMLLEQDAGAASVPCSEQLPVEVHDEGVYRTADILRLAYDVSDGTAGFVSFALTPLAGNDVRGVAAAARRMWYRARRPNVLVQIPATPAGIKAVFRLITEAVNVHVTHIESGEVYRRVAEAYIAGLRHRAECGLPLGGIASFATLPASGGERDVDRAADAYGEMFSEAAFGDLRRLGGRRQILLRQSLRDGRSRLRRVVLLRTDDAHASDGALGTTISSPREQA